MAVWTIRGAAMLAGLAVMPLPAASAAAGPGTPAAPSVRGDASGAAAEGLPPPGATARRVLAAADDDTDRLGEPVAVVLEHARRAGGERVAGDAGADVAARPTPEVPVPLGPDVLVEPDAWRGRAVTVAGRLEQVAARPAAGPDVVEWFVRDASGPVAVLVPGGPDVRPGRRVRAEGWFVRVMAAEARDGTRRRYPLMVAAPHRIAVAGGADGGGIGTTIGLLAAGLLLAAGVLVVARRLGAARSGPPAAASVLAARRRRRGEPAAGPASRTDPPSAARAAAGLPSDPAEALARLRAEADAEADAERTADGAAGGASPGSSGSGTR